MMKRVRSLVVCVSLGTIATLVTAWVPPLIDPPMVSFPGLGLPPGSHVPWVGAPHTAWLGEPAWLATEGHANNGVRRSLGCVEVQSLAYSQRDPRWQYLLASGWPFYALHGGGVQTGILTTIDDDRAPATLPLPTWVPSRQNHPPSVPIGPCWRGLSLNLVFWSAAAAAAIHGRAAIRKRWRVARGRCASCAYPLRSADSVVCPECGATPPTPARRTEA